MAAAIQLKEQGNEAFEAKRYDEAEALYSKAILQDTHQHALFGNRSAARFHQKKFHEALKDAESAIALDSTWAKGHFRKGQALEALNQHRQAQHAYELAVKHGGKKRDVVEKVAEMKKVADKADRGRTIQSRDDWKDIYHNLSDAKLRLALFVKFWNVSTKPERFSFFMRFLTLLSSGGTPARISSYTTDAMEPIPAANYEPIELPEPWTAYFHSLDLTKKSEMMEDMYNLASETEKTTIINDMKYFVNEFYKDDDEDADA
ncbi:Aste57867_12611 [Aphanomyces stellatus]|uniref:Aste57867_12611 protein n=1 Tax=Aphanomyces stellatus TaxID=120398 RepID=A0A485KWG1_9STRA|nr:hypothetical protein As57867_012565 [Aphanomyces stellatus]VFT89461.1 Aste57867_12611 [Aphanomyces stellatus]